MTIRWWFFTKIWPKTCFWAQKYPNAQIWLFGPRPPKMKKKSKIISFTRSILPIRFQQALNDYQMIIFHQDMTKNVFVMSILMLHCNTLLQWGYIWHNNGVNHQYSLIWYIISIIVCITTIINKFYHDLQNGQISFRDDSFRDGDQCLFDQVS